MFQLKSLNTNVLPTDLLYFSTIPPIEIPPIEIPHDEDEDVVVSTTMIVVIAVSFIQ